MEFFYDGEAVLSVLVRSTETLEEIRRWSHHIRTKRPVEWHELPTKFLAPDLTLCIFCEQRGHDEDWWELQKRSTKGISSYCWKWKATKHEVIETESFAEGSISTTTKNQEGAVHATTSTTSEGIGKINTWNETANSTYHISQQNLTTVKRDKMKPHKKQDNIENQTPIIQNVDDNEGGTSRSKRGRISPEDDLEAKAMKPKKPQ